MIFVERLTVSKKWNSARRSLKRGSVTRALPPKITVNTLRRNVHKTVLIHWQRNEKQNRSLAPVNFPGPGSLRRVDGDAWQLVRLAARPIERRTWKKSARSYCRRNRRGHRRSSRWLLGGCSDFLARALSVGELALGEGDLPLAAGHFGYAYQLGIKARDAAGGKGRLP